MEVVNSIEVEGWECTGMEKGGGESFETGEVGNETSTLLFSSLSNTIFSTSDMPLDHERIELGFEHLPLLEPLIS